MSRMKVLYTAAQSTGEMTGVTSGSAISLDGAMSFSSQCSITVDTPDAKTFLSGVAASLVVQDLTYTAVTRGVAGNLITIAYVAGGVAGAEVVTVVGPVISVLMDVTPITGSTATQIKTAIDASAPAAALVTVAVTGTGSTVQAAAATTPLASGVASGIDPTLNTITIASHGFTTGSKGQFTSTGTLPAGISTSTDYFLIVTDSNTFKIATSLANALAGTAVDITGQGTSAATNTFTPTSLAGGTVKLQKSNDGTNWADEGSAVNITATSVLWLEKADTVPAGLWMRVQYNLTAGQLSAINTVVVKGLD